MVSKLEFRKSQGIAPHGVGAIVDFPDDSLMAAGLDAWDVEISERQRKQSIIRQCEVIDQRLLARLNEYSTINGRLKRFLSPLEACENTFWGMASSSSSGKVCGNMPFVRFPQWHFCLRCRVLHEVPSNAGTAKNNIKMRCSGEKRYKKGEGTLCGELPENRRQRLVPVRFAVACEGGHIMDFPWSKWVHERRESCDAGSGELFLKATGGSGLAGVEVFCSRCKAKRTMQGAFNNTAFKNIWPSCPGERPWLGPEGKQLGCQHAPQTVQRGASNVYFSDIVSSILIPPYSQQMRQIIDNPDIWEDMEEIKDEPEAVVERLLRKKAQRYAERYGIDSQAFIKAVQEKWEGKITVDAAKTEEEYRYVEYKAFHGSRPLEQERLDFDIKAVNIKEYDELFQEYFKSIVLVPKLRETRVLSGFSRMVPSESSGMNVEHMSLEPKNWLPSITVRGEGIFLTLDPDRLIEWENMNVLLDRLQKVNIALEELARKRGHSARKITARFLLLHTLSHLLIRQLSYDCGYDSSSLKERLYVSTSKDNPMAGILIYTASGDSEGTLGGLVRQGEAGRLENTVWAALANATMCSSDPLCLESEGQGTFSLNLAACHACALLPETACEEGNMLLDRGLVIGGADDGLQGYFSREQIDQAFIRLK